MNRADATKLSASRAIANGAVSAPISTPATPGPLICAADMTGLELGVAVDDLVSIDERRQVRLVGHVEEDGRAAVDEPDDVELPDRQDVQGEGDRDRDQRGRPDEVAGDEDRASTQAIDPDARWQAEEDERQELDRAEQAELERRDVQRRRRDDRQGEQRHLRPELADRLGRPELHEVGVAKKAAVRVGHENLSTAGWSPGKSR